LDRSVFFTLFLWLNYFLDSFSLNLRWSIGIILLLLVG
jgi:hypothetical protein